MVREPKYVARLETFYIPGSFVLEETTPASVSNELLLSFRNERSLRAMGAAPRIHNSKIALLSAILHPKKVQSDSEKGWGTSYRQRSTKMTEKSHIPIIKDSVTHVHPRPLPSVYFSAHSLSLRGVVCPAVVDFSFSQHD